MLNQKGVDKCYMLQVRLQFSWILGGLDVGGELKSSLARGLMSWVVIIIIRRLGQELAYGPWIQIASFLFSHVWTWIRYIGGKNLFWVINLQNWLNVIMYKCLKTLKSKGLAQDNH